MHYNELYPATLKHVQSWLEGSYDEQSKDLIRKMLDSQPKEVEDAFYTTLSFGTGGLRGLMGIGTNRMNQYTVRAATQGLANYINKQPLTEYQKHAVIIGYDSRHNSRYFAEETAKVMAGNSIEVYLLNELRPVGIVSFGCRYKKCTAGIMITASHNPPNYNGYKVFWSDGAQILPPHDKAIIEEVRSITNISMVKTAELNNPLIHHIADEIDRAYLKAIEALQLYPHVNAKEGHRLKMVYTNLHGTGITMIPRTLSNRGFTNVLDVEQQSLPDGRFPTVKSPNPEEHQALKLGLDKMLATHSDILLGTDPDADRVGVAVNHKGKPILLNGNEIACICLDHICKALVNQKKMSKKGAFIKTIVTTELFKTIAESYGKPCFDVLTGFKYIAELIRLWECEPNGYDFIFGGEESYGYLHGAETRDKDGISASALIAEVALQAKLQGKDLVDLLHELYKKHGVHREKLLTCNFDESKAGKEQMQKAMEKLRKNPPKAICGLEVQIIEDYQSRSRYSLESQKSEPLSLPKSDVLLFRLSDQSKLVVRPSGTEPKIKLYCGVVRDLVGNIEEAISNADKHCEALLKEMEQRLQQ